MEPHILRLWCYGLLALNFFGIFYDVPDARILAVYEMAVMFWCAAAIVEALRK